MTICLKKKIENKIPVCGITWKRRFCLFSEIRENIREWRRSVVVASDLQLLGGSWFFKTICILNSGFLWSDLLLSRVRSCSLCGWLKRAKKILLVPSFWISACLLAWRQSASKNMASHQTVECFLTHHKLVFFVRIFCFAVAGWILIFLNLINISFYISVFEVKRLVWHQLDSWNSLRRPFANYFLLAFDAPSIFFSLFFFSS